MKSKLVIGKKFKIAALIVAGMMAVGVATSFARGNWGGPMFGDRAGAMSRALDLTEEQEKQVRRIVREADAKRDEVLDKYSQSRSAERAEMDKIRESTESAVAAVLNDQQKAKFKEFSEKRNDRHGWKGCDKAGDCGGPSGGGSNCGEGRGGCGKGPGR